MNLKVEKEKIEDIKTMAQDPQNSDSTREDLSKRALRLQNFKKKIGQTKIFEIEGEQMSQIEREKNDEAGAVEEEKGHKRRNTNVTFGQENNEEKGGKMEDRNVEVELLRKKFQDIKNLKKSEINSKIEKLTQLSIESKLKFFNPKYLNFLNFRKR